MAIASPSNAGLVRRLVAPSWVQPEALNVTPELVGMPLAPHARRAWAMAVDLMVVALLSSTGSAWLAVGAVALAFQWLRRFKERSILRNLWLGLLVAFVSTLAVQRVADVAHGWLGSRTEARQQADDDANADASAGADDHDIDQAREILGDKATAALLRSATAASAVSAVSTGVASGVPPVATTLHEAQLAARVKQLEGELAEARKPKPVRWRDELKAAVHRLGLGFGWAIAYFTLLPVWWKGQTVGKKLFGLRVVHLTGTPLTVIGSFGRYGGYAAGMATGASGFLQVLWDSNRQAIQDKIAHTVVVDLRGARATVVVGAAQAIAANASTVAAVAVADASYTGSRIDAEAHPGAEPARLAAPGEDAA